MHDVSCINIYILYYYYGDIENAVGRYKEVNGDTETDINFFLIDIMKNRVACIPIREPTKGSSISFSCYLK